MTASLSPKMPAHTPGPLAAPSLRRMLTAQTAALVFGLPAALMVIFPVGAALEQLRGIGIDPRLIGFLSSFLIYFSNCAVLALVQWLLIRRAVARPISWVLASGLVGVAAMPSLFPATTRLIQSMALIHPHPLVLVFCSALVGAVFGALLGWVQSLWLGAGKGRWLYISITAWAAAWAVAFPLVYLVLYLT